MEELVTESRKTVESTPARARQPEKDNDQEMNACLARLKVWRLENLMSPHGMDKFTEEKKGVPVQGSRK